MRSTVALLALAALTLEAQDTPKRTEVTAPKASVTSGRPFGTQRELAAMQQVWLQKRLDTFAPALLRKHGIDFWVISMREYNEDPVFKSITAPETMAAR
jgi:hypothetical protein